LDDGQSCTIKGKSVAGAKDDVSGIPFLRNPYMAVAAGDLGANCIKHSYGIVKSELEFGVFDVDVHGISY
jgi:hypothetical protein